MSRGDGRSPIPGARAGGAGVVVYLLPPAGGYRERLRV
jgi:hypothetical protein